MKEFNAWLSLGQKMIPNGMGVLDPEKQNQIDQIQQMFGKATPSQGTPSPAGFLPNPAPKNNQPQVVPPPRKKDPFINPANMPNAFVDEVPAVMDEIEAMPELDIQLDDGPTQQPDYAEDPMDVQLDEVPQSPQPVQNASQPLGTLPQELVPEQASLTSDAFKPMTERERLMMQIDNAMKNYGDLQVINQKEIDDMKTLMGKYATQDPGVDWTAPAALADSLFGSQLLQAAKASAPESESARTKNMLDMSQKIENAQSGMSKGQLDANRLLLEQLSYIDQRENQLKIAEINAKAREAAIRAGMGYKEKTFDEKQDARLDQDVQKLEKRIGDIAPGIVTKLKNLNQLVPGGIEGQGDVPGAGPGQFLVPDFLMGENESDIQQNARGLVADYIKLRSGTAASDKEVDRTMKEFGMAPGSKSETFRKGLQRLAKQTIAELRNKEAAFRPEVVDYYRQRQGITYRDVDSIFAKKKDGGGLPPEKQKRLQELKQKLGK